jgi:hypothetical protein
MNNILLSGTVAFLITFFAIPVIIQVAREKKLFDERMNERFIRWLSLLWVDWGFLQVSYWRYY